MNALLGFGPVILSACLILSAYGRAACAATGDLVVTSPAFDDGGMMPDRYAYRGENVSPPIWWSNVPQSAKTVAIICDDPDAPGGSWVHWIIFNIPSASGGTPEGVPHGEALPGGIRQGMNDFRKIGYDGPAPPSGTHRYYFNVYVLDRKIDIRPGSSAKDILAAMEGHILAKGSLMGRYAAKDRSR